MADPVQFRRRSEAQPRLPPPSKQVEDDLAAKLGAENARTLHLLISNTKSSGIWLGAVMGLIAGLIIGWLGYDQTVARVMSQAQDMALKTQITKSMMDSQIER